MSNTNLKPTVIQHTVHQIPTHKIAPHVISVIQHLQMAGFQAYLVGGSVRDLLLNHTPKDFDVVTSAEPREIKKLFRRCHIIGRRFRLAHVYFDRQLIEVATFRAGHEGARAYEAETQNGRILRDNVFGTIDQDFARRDITMNALYYDPITETLFDFCDGFTDLKNQTIRIIGDPAKRFKEDPVRMLRVARFASKLQFKLTPKTTKPLTQLHNLLRDIPPARLYEEVLKCFQYGYANRAFATIRKHQLFQHLFPLTDDTINNDKKALSLIETAIKNTDARVTQQKPVVAYFLFAALLWPAVIHRYQKTRTKKTPKLQTFEQAAKWVLSEQNKHTSIPNRAESSIRDIWFMQNRLVRRRPRSITHLMSLPRFRAAYDLLLLRAKSGEIPQSIADWWTKIQTLNKKEQTKMIEKLR